MICSPPALLIFTMSTVDQCCSLKKTGNSDSLTHWHTPTPTHTHTQSCQVLFLSFVFIWHFSPSLFGDVALIDRLFCPPSAPRAGAVWHRKKAPGNPALTEARLITRRDASPRSWSDMIRCIILITQANNSTFWRKKAHRIRGTVSAWSITCVLQSVARTSKKNPKNSNSIKQSLKKPAQ